LAAGFIGPGAYTILGSAGSGVSLKTTVQVGAPIQLQTTFSAGTTISLSQPLTVKWSGGDANSLVRVTLTGSQSIYAYAHATDGTLTIQPKCIFDPPCAGQVSVDVVPATAQTITAPGVTGPVQATWRYS
jgi:hypothetical protein